ncbi:dienelactone hydrolase [Leptospira sp. WS92.C1]
MMREKKDHIKTIAIRVNRVGLKGELRLPLHSKLLVISVLGEKDGRHLDRFDALCRTLYANGIGTFFLFGLLTEDEKKISANLFDESLLADRLVEVTKKLETLSETKGLKLAYLSFSNIAERIFRASSTLKGKIESLILIGDGLLPLNVVFSDVSILNIIGALDFKTIKSNQIFLNRIETPLKKLYLIPGSPSHFEDPQKWRLVSDTVLKWFSHPERRKLEFAE